jgi:flagellar motor switch protein FliM
VVDFRRPRQFNNEAQRKLRRALDTFCRTASSRLSAELRTAVDLEVINLDQLTWSDAHGQLPGSSMTAILACEPIGTRLLLSAEQPLLVSAIERMLGGSGESSPPQRRLTDIDMMLAGQLFEALIEQLSIIWEELLGTHLSVAGLVSPQQSAQVAPTSEPTLAFTVEAKLLRASMALVLLVPYRGIAPVADRLTAADDMLIEAADSNALDRGIRRVRMEVRAEVGAVDLPIGEVLSLAPGDIVPLHVHSSAGVTLFVDDTAVERGRPGRSGSRRAVQILSPGETAR